MIYMGVDIGGSSRNGIAIIDDNEKILYTTNVPFDKKLGKGNHRRIIAKYVTKLIEQYKVDCLVIERVKMHRGGNFSKLADIVSLSKATGSILDYNHDKCTIYDCETVSWKARILGKRDCTKEDAVLYVKNKYDIDVPHDQADAICQALYLKRYLNTPKGKFHDITEV